MTHTDDKAEPRREERKMDTPPHMDNSMKKYVEIKPVAMEGFPDAHNVFLQVTNQRFCVTKYACETKEEAEWTRDMLCVALAKIVADSGATP